MLNKTNVPNEHYRLKLNSFVRRSNNSIVLKALIKDCGGKLSRIGRSRNWNLDISFEQGRKLARLIYQSDEPTWLWLAKKLAEKKPSYDAAALLDIVRNNPAITHSELVAITSCTVTEARHVLDQIEWS